MGWLERIVSFFGRFGKASFGWTGFIQEAKMLMRVPRKRETDDGFFGTLSIDGNAFGCFTVENKKDAIPAGLYKIEFTYSPEFNQIMPLLDVPGRTAIRIHPANWPNQLLGCIAVGDKEDPDSVDDSRVTFNQLMKIINGQPDLYIQVTDIPQAGPNAA